MWNWIKNLFRRRSGDTQAPPPAPSPEAPAKEDDSNFPKKKIAIIIGHGNGDGGADAWNGSNEFEYNSKVAEYVKSNSRHLVQTFYRGQSGIVGVALKAVAWNPDVSIELHLNSYNGIAKGCEVLVLEGDRESGDLGMAFAEAFCKKFSRSIRGSKGVKWLSGGDRGAASLKVVSPIKKSILVEPFFCDNKAEWIEWEQYAKWLTGWIDTN